MTMNCKQCQNSFDELLDGELPKLIEAKLLEHIALCNGCREAYRQEQCLRKELAALPAPAMRTAFPAEALLKVKQQHHKTHRRGFFTGFGSAVAAGIALWFAITLFSPPVTQSDAMPSISLSVGKVQQVNLVFNSPGHMERATFTLLLPASTELDGYPGRRELTWTASLHKGKNRLSLPLRVTTEQPGEVVARISHGKGVKVFRLKLKVESRSSDSALYQQV